MTKETTERKTQFGPGETLPENAVAIDADTFPPVFKHLMLMWATAPEGARVYLTNALTEVLITTAPRAAVMIEAGPMVHRDDLGTVREDFEGAMEVAKALPQYEELVGSLLEGGLRIADEIDRCIRAHLITAENEEWFNRDAHMDIIAGHAVVLRGIRGLTDVPADFKGPSDDDPVEADS